MKEQVNSPKFILQQSDPEQQIDEQKDDSGCVVLPYVKEIDRKQQIESSPFYNKKLLGGI